MKHTKTGASRGSFDLLLATRSAQAAKMTLRAGGASDIKPSNEHPHSEQWLFVVEGVGEATIGKRGGKQRHIKLAPHSLLLIEKGELHQIRNTGDRALATINFYVPPAYDKNGDPKPTVTKQR
jgi:mannose-6-phosphate isomerase-like protein (cupin superfamily)